MTEKLYYIDSHCYEFSATVLSVENSEQGIAIILDRTAFFPEGGGQKADEGYIGASYIYDAFEKDGIIYHLTKNAEGISSGDVLDCRLDAKLRFARMQAHSGEHIVSGVAHNLFGVENVGFHFDGLVMTVDFDKYLTKEQTEQIEAEANECIYRCLPVSARLYDKNELQNISFRSKIDFSGQARIVEIESVDKCACCAPHVSSTGEIGCIKILSCISHRGGVRLTMICGVAAYQDYCSKYRQTLNIAAMLCAKHDETDIAVERLMEANRELRNIITELKRGQLECICEGIAASDVIFKVVNGIKGDELRELCNLLAAKAEYCVILLSENEADSYSYCIYSEKLKLSSLVADINTGFNGRGGGRGSIMQGKLSGNIDEIKKFVENLRVENYENA